MARGRPGGNPDLAKYKFTTDKPEPCAQRMQLRVPRSLYDRITARPDWQDWVRKILAENLDNSV